MTALSTESVASETGDGYTFTYDTNGKPASTIKTNMSNELNDTLPKGVAMKSTSGKKGTVTVEINKGVVTVSVKDASGVVTADKSKMEMKAE